MMRVLLLALALYGFLALGLTLFQRSFIYPAPAVSRLIPAGFEIIRYPTEDGLTLRAGYRPAARGMPTIVYFHGNGADWQSSVVATDRLVPEGYGALTAEYRGYAGNPGKPSEQGLYADGRAALAWLKEQGIGSQDVVLIGNSIGAGVAVEVATQASPAALVLISPFASLRQLVAEKIFWLPTGPLLRDHYLSNAKLSRIDAPILILHGEADRVIPVSHGRQLAKTNPNALIETYPGAGHELAWLDAAQMRTLAFLKTVVGR
ncbi:MAG: alpha/beta fold hydrolase [Erythrobacter sp.]|nr:alpha/beta fold hydrolase [Erythrobacter sp.]